MWSGSIFFIVYMKTEATVKEDVSLPSKDILREEFNKFIDARHLIINDLKEQLEQILVMIDSSPVVSSRTKNFSSYYAKYIRLLKNGIKKPRIMDLMGIRIICPFIEDLGAAQSLISKNFNVIETEKKGDFTYKEFGYEAIHILITIPQKLITKHGYPGTDILEIQIRTILQDAWAQVEHELVYKAAFNPFDQPMKRKLAAVNASLSLADIIFQEIRSYQRKYTKELEKRRETFFTKIEESTDNLLFLNEKIDENVKVNQSANNTNVIENKDGLSIDDLLVNALTLHNQNRFNDAVNQYSKILDLKPRDEICSIIYKHKGMANFACSKYNEAIDDFTASLNYDKKSYKTAYYRGIVHSVLKQYSQAIDDYSLSLVINPYQPYCLFRRGQAYYHIGDYPQALSDCESSYGLEPSNKTVAKFRKMLLEKLKM